jgi:D-alanine-D-alanine ligase
MLAFVGQGHQYKAMNSSTQRFRQVCVLTGDHRLPDATKPGVRYSQDDLHYHALMREALESLPDYQFEFFNNHSVLIRHMLDDPPEFVLNFCDTGFRNIAAHELHIPALLEMLGIPFSGAPPACMAICYDKALVRMAAESLGMATPFERYIRAQDDLNTLSDIPYPVLIKPNQADGSVGITRDSVAHDADQATNYILRLHREFPGEAVLVQEFLPGAEYGLALIGNPGCGFAALPPLVVDYSALPAGLPAILSYESKTMPGSPYWTNIKIRPAMLDPDILANLVHSAEALFDRLQCRDYARFDFRTATNGTIKLMEVNPNPAWDAEAKLALMAGFAGKSYAQLMEMLLETAQARLAYSTS